MEYIGDKRKREADRKMEETMGAAKLLANLDKLHTTKLGIDRIKRNLSLDTDQVVIWCREKISSSDAVIVRNGKNWYVKIDGCTITINAHSYTIITAHKQEGKSDESNYNRSGSDIASH